MLKIPLAAALACVFAFGEGGFIGAEGDYSFRSNLSWNEISAKKGRTAFGLKGGFDYDDRKFYAAYIYGFETKDDVSVGNFSQNFKWKTYKLIFGGDLTPMISPELKFVAGGYVGIALLDWKYEISNVSGYHNRSDSGHGALFGLRLGGDYAIDERNEVEFGFKADWTKYSFSVHLDGFKGHSERNFGPYVSYYYKF